MLDVTKIQQHQAALGKASAVPVNEMSDMLFHRSCRSIFTLNDTLIWIWYECGILVWALSLWYPLHTHTPTYSFYCLVSLPVHVITPPFNDIMGLNWLSLDTLVPAAPCFVFYATRHQIYWRCDMDAMVFASNLIGTNRLTHINIY